MNSHELSNFLGRPSWTHTNVLMGKQFADDFPMICFS